MGDEGGELELRGKTGSLATAEVPLKVEGQSDLSGALQRDVGAEERWSARVLCRPAMMKLSIGPPKVTKVMEQVNNLSPVECHHI